MTEPKLGPLDFAAIACYFVAVIGVGIYAMCRNRRNTVSGYFLAGRFMTWLPVGASLFASNIGSEHFIGLAGSGAASGIAVGAFELNACFLLQFLGWVFLPVYIASGVCTLPEYIKKRFGGDRIRIYLSVLSLALYIFTKISVNLYSGALFIQQALDWNLYISVLLLLALTGLTTITGGLAAVIYTDTLQAFVMVIGAAVLTAIGFAKVGGYSELYRLYMLAIPSVTPASGNLDGHDSTNPSYGGNFTNHTDVFMSTLTTVYQNVVSGNDSNDFSTTSRFLATSGVTASLTSTNRSLSTAIHECGRPRPDSWYMLRDASDPDMPWPGFLLGQTTASIWYWCADQMIVQRTLAAKSLSHAQGSTLFAGFLKTLPVFILVMPGMISRVLFPDEVACVDPDICMKVCQNRLGCSNIAFPKLVLEIMPSGMKGIMMSVMLAALVSDLTSIFNSASTLFTMDVYRSFRKAARNRELMIVGRVFVGMMVIIGILWIPIVQNMQGAQLFIYIQSVSAYLSPPIAAVYLLAVLWKRANEKGAFYALMLGLLLGSARMILSFVYPDPVCGQTDDRPWIVTGLHYMYFAFILFVVTSLVVVVVSLLTEKPTENQIAQTTYWTRFQQPVFAGNDGNNDVVSDAPEERKLANGKTLTSDGGGGDAQSLLDLPANEKDLVVVFGSPDDAPKVAMEEVAILSVEKNKMVANGQNDRATLKDEEAIVNNPNRSNCSALAAKGVSWFCGLGSEGDDQRSAEVRLRSEEIRSLKQTKTEKRLLTVFLFLLLSLDVGLYVFFSTGSDFWLLRSSVAGETKSSNQ